MDRVTPVDPIVIPSVARALSPRRAASRACASAAAKRPHWQSSRLADAPARRHAAAAAAPASRRGAPRRRLTSSAH
ncbi:hypothetical protein C7S16_3154 [Burkholderia thailandensis]|uniref:Uncharacterized protein n=1 Tax=Burkholderia thailandensis TaxID=57975 RepID=A0AAW9CY07_BURTH|nr:hypothetical protein [Burkholderia thailandensis]MDW9254781.1 hypothetical protein [Burkholderia thailandensis]